MGDLAETSVAVIEFLRSRGQQIVHLSADRPNLESIFLTLTGRNLRDP